MSKKKILYVQTSGVDIPERTYAPFILGATAVAMNMEATIFFGIKGVTIMKKGEADKVKMPAPFGSLKEALDQATKAGVKYLVCDESSRMLGMEPGGFIEGVEIVGAATLNDLVINSDAVMYF